MLRLRITGVMRERLRLTEYAADNFSLKTEEVTRINNQPIHIGICEIVAASGVGGKEIVGSYLEDPGHREMESLNIRGKEAIDLLQNHKELRCKIIAYQRPKPGKQSVIQNSQKRW